MNHHSNRQFENFALWEGGWATNVEKENVTNLRFAVNTCRRTQSWTWTLRSLPTKRGKEDIKAFKFFIMGGKEASSFQQRKCMSKIFLAAVLVASASAFTPVQQQSVSTALFNGPTLGAGGMADTRNPDAVEHEDPRKSISAAPSFEEYLKMRDGGGGGAAPAAPAPAAAAPAPAAPAPAPASTPREVGGGGSVLDTLAALEGPGQVWGADGIAVGKEESDLKGYDGFSKFIDRLKSSGVANEISGNGPYTIFAPVDSAVEIYEKNFGPFDAEVCKLHIVPGKIASSQISSTPLPSLAGKDLVYKRAVRKDFVNDVVIGEKTFGPYNDFPIDIECSNGIIHGVSLSLAS
eukprot:scaffold24005_cov196-Cylindrotheca_fusiformis.AAC.3